MLVSGLTAEEERVIAAHSEYLGKLTALGVVILYGRTQTADEDTFGLVILRSDSEASARQIMEDDPVVKEGVMRAKLYPYRVAGRTKD